MKLTIILNQSDKDRMEISKQALPILKNPRILAEMIETNRRILSPLWQKLIEEGNKDGSINTKYVRELAELLPLLDIWMLPSIYPATEEELENKAGSVRELFSIMGLPLFNDELAKTMNKTYKNLEE